MGKLLKFAAWALAACVLLALLSFAALKLYFTPDRIRALVASYAQANLKRETSLDSASLGLRGFSMRNLRVAERPGAAAGDFLTADEFSVRPDFRALLKKQLKIKSVSASGLKLNIVELKKDSYNFDDLLAPAAPAADGAQPAAAPASAPPAFNISRISVENSRLSYTSADGKLGVVLDGIRLSADSLSAEGTFPFEADLTLRLRSAALKGDFPVYARGKASLGGLDPKMGKASIEKALVNAGKINCELAGSLENFLEPDAKLKLKIKPFSSSDLKEYFPAAPARILLPAVDAGAELKLTAKGMTLGKLDFKAGPAEGSVKGFVAWEPAFRYDLHADLKAQTPEMKSDALAKKFPAVPKGLNIPFMELEAGAHLLNGRAMLNRSRIAAAGVSAALTGDFSFEPVSAEGVLTFTAGDVRTLAAVHPALKPYGLRGGAAGNLGFSYGKAGLQFNGKANLTDISADVSGKKLAGLKGSIEITKDQVNAPDLSGKLDGAEAKAALSVKNYTSHPQVRLDLDLAAVRLPALSPGGPAEKAAGPAGNPGSKPFAFDLSGSVRLGAVTHPNFMAGETTASCDLKHVSDDMRKLSGHASFEVKGGRFEKLYELAKAHKAAKVALYPLLVLQKAGKAAKGLNLPDFDTIAFTKLEGDYLFTNGVMKLQRSSLLSNVADVSSSGSVNLPADALDLKINTALKEGSGVRMSAPVAMTVKGTMDDPKVKLDVKSVMEQPAVKKNLDKALKGGEKLLKGLFK